MSGLWEYNYHRVKFIREIIYKMDKSNFNPVKPLEGKKCLDIGCGGGFLSESLARLGANVIGIDATKNSIDKAKNHLNKDSELKNRL